MVQSETALTVPVFPKSPVLFLDGVENRVFRTFSHAARDVKQPKYDRRLATGGGVAPPKKELTSGPRKMDPGHQYGTR